MVACRRATKVIRNIALGAAALFAAGFLSGCDTTYTEDLRYPERSDPLVVEVKTAPSHFDPPGQFPAILVEVPAAERDKDVLYPEKLDSRYRDALATNLEKFFGTPAQPKVDGIEPSVKTELKLDPETLTAGANLYRLHCLHCHGLSGNGRGPTAPWVNPHPRDYRQGIFKFTSSNQPQKSRKPRRDDLYRTVRLGIEGTSMPAHVNVLSPEQLEQVVSYVIHLSIRGETEFITIRDLLRPSGSEELPKPGDAKAFEDYFRDSELSYVAGRWGEAHGKTIVPDVPIPSPENAEAFAASVRRGYHLFQSKYTDANGKVGTGLGCISCHEDYGRKDHLLYDAWGTVVRPADLTRGVYRGGRRPIDLFWRIYAGIDGVNMPEPAGAGADKARDVWDVVNFLQVLPYASMHKEFDIDIK